MLALNHNALPTATVIPSFLPPPTSLFSNLEQNAIENLSYVLDRKVVEKVKRKERKKEKRIVRTFLVRHRDNERGGGWGVKEEEGGRSEN